jgi:hypothetical protein
MSQSSQETILSSIKVLQQASSPTSRNHLNLIDSVESLPLLQNAKRLCALDPKLNQRSALQGREYYYKYIHTRQ